MASFAGKDAAAGGASIGEGSATRGGQEIASSAGSIMEGINALINCLNGDAAVAANGGAPVQPGKPIFLAKLCFLLDCTGSMSKEIAAAKEKLTSIMTECNSKFGGKLQLKVAFVGYRDVSDGDRRFEILPFTTSTTEASDFIHSITAGGGDDEAEDVVGGLQEVLNLDWSEARIKVLFHVGDAPGHGTELHAGVPGVSDSYPSGVSGQKPWREVIEELAACHIDVYFGQISGPSGIRTDTMLRNFKQVYDATGHQRQNYTIIPALSGYSPNDFFTHVMASLSTSIFKHMASTMPSNIAKLREAKKGGAK